MKIQLVFEEIIQILAPVLKVSRIQAICEYSELNETAVWMFNYGGEKVDISDFDDELPLTLIKGMVFSTSYTYNKNQNQLQLTIKS